MPLEDEQPASAASSINDINEPKNTKFRYRCLSGTPAGQVPFFRDYPSHSRTVGRCDICCDFKISRDFCCNLRFQGIFCHQISYLISDLTLILGNGVFLHPSLGPSTLSQQENMWLTAGFHLFLFVDACTMAEMLQLFCSNNIAPEPNICQTKITMTGIFCMFSDSSTTSAIVGAVPLPCNIHQ